MSESRVNPKLLVSEYFDALINRVDIHTEEQLEKYWNKDTMENPDKTNNEQKSVLVWDYLNKTREKMIKKISEAQVDALKRLEVIKNDIKSSEKVFANHFMFLIQINSFRQSKHSEKTSENKSVFKLVLIETFFFINESQMLILKYKYIFNF